MSGAKHEAAIIGGGVIGGGWAARLLLNGWDVRVFDPDPAARHKTEAVLANARRALPGLWDTRPPAEGHIRYCQSISETARDVPLVIEAVPERLEVKHLVYEAIETVNETGLIASSTSGLMPSDLQSKMCHPQRLIVAHPFNPVYLLPLVELVAGQQTDPAKIAEATGIYRALGMYPLHCRVEIEGFLSDRLQEALWREALWLLKDKVATAQELDTAIAFGPGLRWAQMGTMQTFHLAGGEGGMRAMLAMFGPCLKWPWTKLTDVPELTDTFVEMVGQQCDAQAGGRDPRQLEQIRDDNLVAILRALKGRDWGAGHSLNQADDARRAADPEPDFRAPVRVLEQVVPSNWTDYNGHMNEARYLEAFSKGTDRFMEMVGVDAAYIASGGSYFTAETHIRHLAEVRAGGKIRVDTLLLSGRGKKMHIFNRMSDATGRLLATGEQILIHVSLKTRRASPPADHIADKLTMIEAHHAKLPRPEGIGRAVGQRPSAKP